MRKPAVIPIGNLGEFGIVSDIPSHELPLNAWSGGRNIRFRDGCAEKFLGYSEALATPLWAPYWMINVISGSDTYWLYMSLTKAGATDMITHADITRASGDYAGTELIGWTGGVLNGIPVVTNGVDTPQMWTSVSLGQRLQALSNWPANYLCRSIRPFKSFLLAMNVTKSSGTHHPQMVKWSHPADIGAVPSTWDETDPTRDAGEIELAETTDFVMDALSLRDVKIIYKEYSTYGCQYIGGVEIFRFYKIFDSFGMFARKCAVEFFNGKHIVFTGDDVVLHDGQQAESIIKGRLRRYLSSNISPINFALSFVAVNYEVFEVWICFPEVGSDRSNRALVWNWKENKWGIRDLPLASIIATGIVNPIAGLGGSWSGDSNSWASDGTTWGNRSFQPYRRTLMAVPSQTKFFLLDDTNQDNEVDMTAYVERTGLGFPLKVDSPPDFTTNKQITRLWPRIEGTNGGVVNVYVGTQDKIDGNVTYGSAKPYIIGSTKFLDVNSIARLHALKFESTSNIDWRLHGYEVEINDRGKH